MPYSICTPTLKCPFCGSETLLLFRSKMCLAFDILDEGEKSTESAPVTALLCGANHFFFVRCNDIRIQAFAPLAENSVWDVPDESHAGGYGGRT